MNNNNCIKTWILCSWCLLFSHLLLTVVDLKASCHFSHKLIIILFRWAWTSSSWAGCCGTLAPAVLTATCSCRRARRGRSRPRAPAPAPASSAATSATARGRANRLISEVSYSRPSLMIIASRTQFHVERPWGQRQFSIVSPWLYNRLWNRWSTTQQYLKVCSNEGSDDVIHLSRQWGGNWWKHLSTSYLHNRHFDS